jgi:hypothetical protein
MPPLLFCSLCRGEHEKYSAKKERPTSGRRAVRARINALACASAMHQLDAVLDGPTEEFVSQTRAEGFIYEESVQEEFSDKDFVLNVVAEEVVQEEILNNEANEDDPADEPFESDSSDEISVDNESSAVANTDVVDLNEQLPTITYYVHHPKASRPVVNDNDKQDILAVLCAEFGLSSSGKAEAHASEESCSTREA